MRVEKKQEKKPTKTYNLLSPSPFTHTHAHHYVFVLALLWVGTIFYIKAKNKIKNAGIDKAFHTIETFMN